MVFRYIVIAFGFVLSLSAADENIGSVGDINYRITNKQKLHTVSLDQTVFVEDHTIHGGSNNNILTYSNGGNAKIGYGYKRILEINRDGLKEFKSKKLVTPKVIKKVQEKAPIQPTEVIQRQPKVLPYESFYEKCIRQGKEEKLNKK